MKLLIAKNFLYPMCPNCSETVKIIDPPRRKYLEIKKFPGILLVLSHSPLDRYFWEQSRVDFSPLSRPSRKRKRGTLKRRKCVRTGYLSFRQLDWTGRKGKTKRGKEISNSLCQNLHRDTWNGNSKTKKKRTSFKFRLLRITNHLVTTIVKSYISSIIEDIHR